MGNPVFVPTKEQVSAARAVLMAMALVETIKPVVRGYQTRILREMQAGLILNGAGKAGPDVMLRKLSSTPIKST